MLWVLALDTLAVDDGVEGGQFFLPESSWVEAVRIPHDSLVLWGFLFRSGGGRLRWLAWAGTPQGPDSLIASDSLDASEGWISVNLPQSVYLPPGELFVGWRGGEPYYYQYYDSRADGYNWFFDGASWEPDTALPGDLMIRAFGEEIGVREAEGSKGPYLKAGPGWLELFWQGPGTLKIYDARGSLVLSVSKRWQGRHRLLFPGLGKGAFLAELGPLRAKLVLP